MTGDFGGGPPGGGGFGQPPGGGGFGQPPGGGGFGPPPGGGFGPPPGAGGFGQPPGGFGHPPGPGMGAAPPSDYKTAGVLMLISGIVNVMVSLTWVLVLIWICVGVFWFATLGAAVFEIVVAATVMQGRVHAQAKTASILGLVAGLLSMNIISIVLEIIALVMLSKPEVSHYLASGR